MVDSPLSSSTNGEQHDQSFKKFYHSIDFLKKVWKLEFTMAGSNAQRFSILAMLKSQIDFFILEMEQKLLGRMPKLLKPKLAKSSNLVHRLVVPTIRENG
jgi:hypothetical protein